MERHRTGGMTAIAVLNVVVGGLVILNGVYELLGFLTFMHEEFRLGILMIDPVRIARSRFALVLLTTGIVGLVAGIGIFALRSWARATSLVYAGLLIFSAVLSYFVVPIIATIGTYDLGAVGGDGLIRLLVFGLIDIGIPVTYSLLLCAVFCKPAWKTAFAKGWTA